MALPANEIGRRIRQVREETGVAVSELARALGLDEGAVLSLEVGGIDPLPGDYVLIAARVLNTDFRYFITEQLDEIEDRTRKLFRALSNLTPADLLAVRRFLSLCLRESELEELLHVSRPPLPPTYPSNGRRLLHKEQGPLAARAERDRLRLGNLPIRNVFEVLRTQGVRLFRHRLLDTELSGVTVLHPNAGVCVLINYHEDLYRQFFSAAHEYGHVLFDRETISREGHIVSHRYTQAELQELRCNTFAAEFLLPETALQRFERPRDIGDVTRLLREAALQYRVNTEPVAIRLREAGWISERTLESFRRIRPVVIRRREKVDPELPDGLTETQAERRSLAAETGFTTYYLELLRRGLTRRR
jgi:Zn-dependent peptidase ImmA (M78 family)/transcriptional regulator with XRE-family HTH domain